ncbi:MAG TPA: Ig-like domain repeat protein [Baekduia sp.]
MQGRRLVRILALAGFCLPAALAASAQAATDSLYAAPSAAGAGDCSSPADACSIVDAVTDANAASVADSVRIELAGGTYSLSSPSPTVLSITFAGPSLTLDAGSGTPILDGMHAVRLLSVGTTSNVTIDGLHIESGAASANGGGIENRGTLTVKRSTLSGNSAPNGGGIANDAGATLTVQDSTFSDNTTSGVGGGAIISLGTTTVERSAIVHNTAPLNGGGINVQPSGTATVTSSTIAENTSGGLGGGLSNLGTLAVEASTIKDNTGSDGSAIATGNANVTFAADIVAAPPSVNACNPANAAIVDGGYNLDSDGTCISPTAPAIGSHNGTTAYGSSTYGAVLDAYLADGLANNGGPTQTAALLNSPDPSTSLANPAFDVVPASFALPVAVDGVSAACALADQRGVVSVAGANCAIGAYLLQATRTVVTTSAAKVHQNESVTYTATVTPAPDGGTVSFDDGAANPATTHCAAQSVANGRATCTVSYANAGDYPVAATYSGDAALNNYVGSASASTTQMVDVAAAAAAPAPAAAAPIAATPDRTPPTTTIRRVTTTKQPITLHGTASDAAGSIRRVRVSVARHIGKLCRFLQANRTFSKARSCDKTSYLDAKGTSAWSLKLPSLPHGRYTIWTRGIDAAGNVERKGRGRNLLVLRIPTQSKASTHAGLAATSDTHVSAKLHDPDIAALVPAG